MASEGRGLRWRSLGSGPVDRWTGGLVDPLSFKPSFLALFRPSPN